MTVDIDGDTDKLVEDIKRETLEHDPFSTPLEGDTERLVEDIIEVTEDADPYEVPLEAKTDDLVSSVQGALDAGDFKVKVSVDVDTENVASAAQDAADSAASSGGGRSGGSRANGGSGPSSGGGSGGGSGPPKFGAGGMVSGASHAQGGVLAELEGGEYVIPKGQVTPETRAILDEIRGGANVEQAARQIVDGRPILQGLTGPVRAAGAPSPVPSNTAVSAPSIDLGELVSSAASARTGLVPPSTTNSTAVSYTFNDIKNTTYVNISGTARGSVYPIREIGAVT